MSSFLDQMTPRGDDALEFLGVWFRGVSDDELISVVRIHPTSSKTSSFVFSIADVKGAIQSSGLDTLIWDGDTHYDLYFSVATLKEKPERGKRGGLKNVHLVPGVWIDFDVKDGYFSSQQEILDFLHAQQHQPSLEVLTGKQGVHAYWKFQHALLLENAKELALRWWVYQSELAGDRKIDKLVDPSRVMRLPGSIRWPKKSAQGTAVCSLLNTVRTLYPTSFLEQTTEGAWDNWQKKVTKTREDVLRKSHDAKEFAKNLAESNDNIWLRRLAIADMEDHFNETYSWDQILVPEGWTKLGTDEEGRVLWSRPGDGIRKSATTDWPESPHVMSLFSTAPETGLADLQDSEIILTKYRVWIQLVWGGDEIAAVERLLQTQSEA